MHNHFLVKIPKSINKRMARFPLPWQRRIIRTMTFLETEPFLGGKLKGEYKEQRRVYIKPYRITYILDLEQRIIEIVEVERRGNMSYD